MGLRSVVGDAALCLSFCAVHVGLGTLASSPPGGLASPLRAVQQRGAGAEGPERSTRSEMPGWTEGLQGRIREGTRPGVAQRADVRATARVTVTLEQRTLRCDMGTVGHGQPEGLLASCPRLWGFPDRKWL